jgi:putative copper export protein
MYPLIPWSGWTIDGLARNALTGVHVLGALLWVGGLVVLAAAGLIGRRRARTEAGGADVSATAEWMQIWERFSVVALFAVGALIVSGTWLAWSHVGTVGQLVTTTYGRYLGVKLLLVIGLMVAGAYNMRVLLPRIRTARSAGDTRSALHLAATHFPLVVLAEAVTGTGVLAIVPFLRGSARSQAGWAAARPFDLTVAGTGLVLVALVAFALWAGTRTPKAKGPAAETTARPAVDATTGAAPTADR